MLGFWLGENLSGFTDQYALLRKGAPAMGLGSVFQAIRNATGRNLGLSVEMKTWESMAEMTAAKTLADMVEGGYDRELGLLARRADIVLEDPGACDVAAAGAGS